MIKDLFYLFFPRLCPGCEAHLLEQEKAVCWNCLNAMEETGFHLEPDTNILFQSLAGLASVEGAAAYFYFDKGGRLQKIITALKYQNQAKIGRSLGEHYGRKLVGSPMLEGVEAIIPVPLHPRKEAIRGYNQAEEIALGISSETGIPVRSDLMIRRKATRTQTRKGREDRWENVKEIFGMKSGFPGGILLVDDVITTGSTLLGCIRALEQFHPRPSIIKVAAIGMTRKSGS